MSKEICFVNYLMPEDATVKAEPGHHGKDEATRWLRSLCVEIERGKTAESTESKPMKHLVADYDTIQQAQNDVVRVLKAAEVDKSISSNQSTISTDSQVV